MSSWMRRLLLSLLFSLLSASCFAGGEDASCSCHTSKYYKYEIYAGYGTGSLINVGQSRGLNMVRLSGVYTPESWHYYGLALGLDLSYNMIFDSKAPTDTNDRLVIFSLAPVLRYYFSPQKRVNPYLEISVGPSYLSNRYLGKRKLGIQYAFQLFAGVGTRIKFKHYAMVTGLRIMHWSNAYIAKKNAGVNVPLMLYMGVQI